MGKPCRPCEMAAAVGIALDLCNERNIGCGKMKKLYEEESEDGTSEEDVLDALLSVIEELPVDSKIEGRAILCAAFPSHPEGCAKLSEEEVKKDG